MKNIMGMMTLLLFSQPIFADEMKMNQTEMKLLESDAALIETSPAAQPTSAVEKIVMQEQSGFSRGSVVRSAFTREISDREPIENLQNLTSENGKIMFFTELRDMAGQTAIHRWEYEGNIVAEVKFNVKGPRWRVWSSKSLIPQWTGDWKVSVINGAGEVISEKNLNYSITAVAVENMTKIIPTTSTTPDVAAESMQ